MNYKIVATSNKRNGYKFGDPLDDSGYQHSTSKAGVVAVVSFVVLNEVLPILIHAIKFSLSQESSESCEKELGKIATIASVVLSIFIFLGMFLELKAKSPQTQ